MSNSFLSAKLKEIMEPIERPEVPIPGKTYRQLGVKLWGEGAYERDSIDGSQTRYKTFSKIEACDIVVNKIWARNGSVAVVPANMSGCYVSGEFPTFNPIRDRLEPRWFHWFTKTKGFWSQCDEESQGTSGKNRIRPERFLEIEIPLPKPNEQRRIVARIEELAARIEEARELRRRISDSDLQNLRIAAFCRPFQGKLLTQNNNDEPASVAIEKMAALKLQLVEEHKIKAEKPLPSISEIEKQYQLPKLWDWVRLGDICELITDGTHQTPKYTDEGMIFLSAQNVKPYRFMPQNHRHVSYEDYLTYIQHAKPEKGDILMTRVGAMIGEAAIIDQDLDFAFYVSLCLMRPLRDHVHVPYILHWLNSPYGAISSIKNTLGKGHSQGNLNLNLIRRFVLPLPPLNEQRRIVAYLDGLQSKLDALQRHQTEITAELDALMPSILERAFRGEL